VNEGGEECRRDRDRRWHDQRAVRRGREAEPQKRQAVEAEELERRRGRHRAPAVNRQRSPRDDDGDDKQNRRDRESHRRELEWWNRAQRDLRRGPLCRERQSGGRICEDDQRLRHAGILLTE